MRLTRVDEDRYYAEMRGNFELEDVIRYISTAFRVDEIFQESELREWALDNNFKEEY